MYLIIPDEGFKKLRGLDCPQHSKINIHDRAIVPIELLHKHFGAVIVTSNKKILTEDWRLPPDAPYIIEGWTASEYAAEIEKSRQTVHEKIKNRTLVAERIGGLWIIFLRQNEEGSK